MSLRHRLLMTATLAVTAIAAAGGARAQSIEPTGTVDANVTIDRRLVPVKTISHCLTFSEPNRAKCLAAEKSQKPKPRSRQAAVNRR